VLFSITSPELRDAVAVAIAADGGVDGARRPDVLLAGLTYFRAPWHRRRVSCYSVSRPETPLELSIAEGRTLTSPRGSVRVMRSFLLRSSHTGDLAPIA